MRDGCGLSGRPSGRHGCGSAYFARWDATCEAAADSLCDVKLPACERPRPDNQITRTAIPWSSRLKDRQHALCAVRRPPGDDPPLRFAECLGRAHTRFFQPRPANDGCASHGRPETLLVSWSTSTAHRLPRPFPRPRPLWRSAEWADQLPGASRRVVAPRRRLVLGPDRDVAFAAFGQGRLVPVGPAILQTQPRHLGHEVKFRGPHVPERHRAARDASVGPRSDVV